MANTGRLEAVTHEYVYTQSGNVETKTIILSPQTTTYTPTETVTHNGCRPPIYCEFGTSEIGPEKTCLGWDWVNEKNNYPVRPDCYPSNYFQIFWPVSGWDEISTLAYPGDACVSGWTTACTTTLIQDGKSYPQTWCCPESSWACVDPARSYRGCVSLVQSPTLAWFTLETPTGSILFENATYPVFSGFGKGLLVEKNMFPLQGPSKQPPPVPSERPPREENGASGTTLSAGAIAGIAVGAGVGALAAAAILVCFVVRRRTHRREGTSLGHDASEVVGAPERPPAVTAHDGAEKNGGEGPRAEMPNTFSQVELQTGENVTELSAPQGVSEIGHRSAPVELG